MLHLTRKVQILGLSLIVVLAIAVGLHLSQGGDTPSAPGGGSGPMQAVLDHIEKMSGH